MTGVFQSPELMWNRYYVDEHMGTRKLMHTGQDGDLKIPVLGHLFEYEWGQKVALLDRGNLCEKPDTMLDTLWE
jgi:hypothetical protein